MAVILDRGHVRSAGSCVNNRWDRGAVVTGLENPRHEQFAQAIAQGVPVKDAALASGLELPEFDKPAGFYVYILVDPRSDELFYVGKGKADRALRHSKEWKNGQVVNARKFNRIGEIILSGHKVEVLVLDYGMSERSAFRLERGMIDRIGFERLTNVASGSFTENEKALAAAKHALAHISRVEWNKPRVRGDITNDERFAIYDSVVRDLRSIVAELETELEAV